MNRFASLAILLCASTLSAAENPSAQIGVLVEYYELDHAALPPLLEDYQKESAATALLSRIQKMAIKGDARLMESAYLVTRNGQRAKIESIRELNYPTGYDPSELFEEGTAGEPTTQNLTIIPPRVTSIEMRPVGNTLEVDLDLSGGGKYVEFNIAPELVEFRGFQRWGKDETSPVKPLFYSMKSSSALTVKVGTSELLAVHTPADAHGKGGEGKRVLSFVTPLLLKDGPAQQLPTKELPLPIIRTHLEIIETDAQVASELIRSQGGSVDATAILQELDKQIAKGDAKVLHSNFLLTRSGERATIHSVQEYDYPTEADPPSGMGSVRKEGEPPPMLASSPVSGVGQYEMQILGLTFELDPVASADGNFVALNIAPEVVRLAYFQDYGKGRFACQQPVFETLKIGAAVTAANGKPLLLGMHSLETARASEIATEAERDAVRNRRILVFVTATIKHIDYRP